MMVGVDIGSCSVVSVAVINMREPERIGARVKERAFLSFFDGKGLPLQTTRTAPKNQSEVQTISGATISSAAVASGVRAALETARALISADNMEEVG